MLTTSVTLLERLRDPADQLAWERFVDLYTPLLLTWARRAGCNEHDAADLVQEVLSLLFRRLPQFTYQRDGSFRAWLKTVTFNRWRDFWRKKRVSAELLGDAVGEVPAPDAAATFEEAEYRKYLFQRALQTLEPEYSAKDWSIFRAYVLESKDVGDVAAANGVSPGTVYAIKSRILARMRSELQGLLD